MSIIKSLKRFGIIYKRNLIGALPIVFLLAPLLIFSALWPFLPLAFFLPIILGVTIKSIIDFGTRKFLDKERIEKAKDNLYQTPIESFDLEHLFKEILESTPESHSSKKVKRFLLCTKGSVQYTIREDIEKLTSTKRKELNKLFLTPEEQQAVQEEYFASDEYKNLLQTFKQNIQSPLYTYLSSKHNFGKRTHNKICRALENINLTKSTKEFEGELPRYNSFFSPFMSSSKQAKKESHSSFVDLSASIG
jgi:hypothetical protein